MFLRINHPPYFTVNREYWCVKHIYIFLLYLFFRMQIYQEREKPLRATMRKGKTGRYRRREQRVAITVLLMIGIMFKKIIIK